MKKKYFSISEVSKLTGLSASKLRYIEKYNPFFKVIKIRDRRYYTDQNLKYITDRYRKNKNMVQTQGVDHSQIIKRIDNILERFREFI